MFLIFIVLLTAGRCSYVYSLQVGANHEKSRHRLLDLTEGQLDMLICLSPLSPLSSGVSSVNERCVMSVIAGLGPPTCLLVTTTFRSRQAFPFHSTSVLSALTPPASPSTPGWPG